MAPPVQAPPPGYHAHDGFYLRMGLGFGAMSSTFDYQSSAQNDMNVRGGGVGIDLWMGGTLIRGLVVGGALIVNSGDEAKDRVSGLTSGLSQTALLVFVDGFPDPTGGFDLGGGAGFMSTSSPDNSSAPTPKTNGLGVAIWGGYTGWVSDNWSLGGLARLGLARTAADGVKSGSLSMIVEFTALYH
jgi:hypothetical protein